MPKILVVIDDLVAGDNRELRRTITNIPVGLTIAKAWCTIKARTADADPGIVQKIITTSNVPGVGQIEDTGVGDQIGEIRFDLTGTDTALLVPADPRVPLVFDIQVKLSDGSIYTLVVGTIAALPQVTVVNA